MFTVKNWGLFCDSVFTRDEPYMVGGVVGGGGWLDGVRQLVPTPLK